MITNDGVRAVVDQAPDRIWAINERMGVGMFSCYNPGHGIEYVRRDLLTREAVTVIVLEELKQQWRPAFMQERAEVIAHQILALLNPKEPT